MTVSLSLAVKEYLLLHKKIEDINVYHISQLPELPKKGAFLLQDRWRKAGKLHKELMGLKND